MDDIDRGFVAKALPICDKNPRDSNLKNCQYDDYKSSEIQIGFGSFRKHVPSFCTPGTQINTIFGTDLTRMNFSTNWCNSGSPMYSFQDIPAELSHLYYSNPGIYPSVK